MYKLSKNEKIIRDSVEKTHPQMTPTIITVLSQALMPQDGTIIAAPSGMGKTRTLKVISSLTPNSIWLDNITPAGIKVVKIGNRTVEEMLCNCRSFLYFDDVTTLVNSSVLEPALMMLSQLLFEGRYRGITSRQGNVDNAEVSVTMGSTLSAIRRMMRSGSWESQVRERFTVITPVYYRRPSVDSKFTPKVKKFKMTNPTIPSFDMSDEMFEECVDIMKEQHTENRSKETVMNITTGHAIVCGRKSVTDKNDGEWFKLLEPFFTLMSHFITRVPISYYGYDSASPPLLSDIPMEIVYWCSERPQSYKSLHRCVQHLHPNAIKKYVKKLVRKPRKGTPYLKDIGLKNRKLFTVTGSLEEKLREIYDVHGCKQEMIYPRI